MTSNSQYCQVPIKPVGIFYPRYLNCKVFIHYASIIQTALVLGFNVYSNCFTVFKLTMTREIKCSDALQWESLLLNNLSAFSFNVMWVKCNLNLFFYETHSCKEHETADNSGKRSSLNTHLWFFCLRAKWIMKSQFIFVLFCKLPLLYRHCHTNNCWHPQKLSVFIQAFSMERWILRFCMWSRNTSVRVLCQLWIVNVWGLWHRVLKTSHGLCKRVRPVWL